MRIFKRWAMLLCSCSFLISCSENNNSSPLRSVTPISSNEEIKSLFASLRPLAENIAKRFDVESFDEVVHLEQLSDAQKLEIRKFLDEKHLLLANDIASSKHVWVESGQNVCAVTGSEVNSAIQFSYEKCIAMLMVQESAAETSIEKPADKYVVLLLIRESLHHLGIGLSAQDEKTADRIAIALYETSKRVKIGNLWMGSRGDHFEVIHDFRSLCGHYRKVIDYFYMSNLRSKVAKLIDVSCGTPKITVENPSRKTLVSEGSYLIELTTPLYIVQSGETIEGMSMFSEAQGIHSFAYKCLDLFRKHETSKEVLAVDCQIPKDVDESENVTMVSTSVLLKQIAH